MGNVLDAPITAKDSEAFTSSQGLEVGASGMQGWRLEMEDSHISMDIPTKPDHLFVAVFDGHGGGGAAKYASKFLVQIFQSTTEWRKYLEQGEEDPKLIGEALTAAFIRIDEQLREVQSKSNEDTSGATAVTAVVTPKYIICANAGDSRCVMGIENDAKPLSDDHKPYNPEERKRIEDAGGSVQFSRVDGELAVSRALGDFSFKDRPDLGPEKQKVTCLPDITVHERTSGDDVLLLACDGLWDVMSSEEAIIEIREIFKTGEKSLVMIAEEILDMALNKGSKDNISSVVVKLPDAKIASSGGGVADRREKRSEVKRVEEEEAAAAQAERITRTSAFNG